MAVYINTDLLMQTKGKNIKYEHKINLLDVQNCEILAYLDVNCVCRNHSINIL